MKKYLLTAAFVLSLGVFAFAQKNSHEIVVKDSSKTAACCKKDARAHAHADADCCKKHAAGDKQDCCKKHAAGNKQDCCKKGGHSHEDSHEGHSHGSHDGHSHGAHDGHSHAKPAKK